MNFNKFFIREALKGDHVSLATLMTELGYPTTAEEMEERVMAITKEPGYKIFVAEADGVVVGTAGVCKSYYFEQNGCYLRLGALVTKEGHTKKGIGKALVKAVEEWAIEVGATALLLNCGNREERKGAHAFYQQLGFKAKSTGYVKPLSNKI